MANNKHKSALRLLRIWLEVTVFCAFVLLFFDFLDIFQKALGFLPKLEFWPAVLAMNVGIVVLLIAITAVFGRIYCSSLCPLGIYQDAVYAVKKAGSKKRRFQQSWSKPKNWLRWSVLAVFLILACLGVGSIAYLLEPYSIFGRFMVSIKTRSLLFLSVSLLTFLTISILAYRNGRTWCNTICPVGTILGIFSRHSLFRPVIKKESCISCGLCGKACRASCIDTANHSVDMSRCVMCFDCLDNCSHGAIEYKFSLEPFRPKTEPKTKPEQTAGQESGQKPVDESRRSFLTVAALAATSAAVSCVSKPASKALAAAESKSFPVREVPVVPAGAKSLKHFSDHCIGCHLCVSACPNNVLSPSTSLDHIMQPLMNFEEGWCRPECTACSQVCPAGAILKISPERKTSISIGHAVFNPENCVVVTDSVGCGNCASHCPAHAISMELTQDGLLPFVNNEKCIGCGRCEYVCPARPFSAIHVEGNSVHRDI